MNSNSKKKVRFNAVLEDFRKFASEDSQGDSESAAPAASSDKEVTEVLPGGGNTKGGPTEPISNLGAAQGESLPGVKTSLPEETQEHKEVSPSSKVASDAAATLVNSLLANIKVASEELAVNTDDKGEKQEKAEPAQDVNPTVTAVPAKSSLAPVAAKAEDKKASEVIDNALSKFASALAGEKKTTETTVEKTAGIDEDSLAEKIASHYRNVSVGYELGRFLFGSLGQKQAEDPMAAGLEAGGAPVDPMAAGAPPEAEAAPAEGGGDEIQILLQALQELVAEGQITPEQAEQALQAIGGAEGGGEAAPAGPAPEEAMMAPEGGAPIDPMAEEAKVASDIFSQEEKAEIEQAINSKVAEWQAEGKTEGQISELIKEAARVDAEKIREFQADRVFNDVVLRKVAAFKELNASQEQINAFVKEASENRDVVIHNELLERQVEQAIINKVASLRKKGKNDTEIEEYMKEAAANDAEAIRHVANVNFQKNQIMSKIAAMRKEANDMMGAPASEEMAPPAPEGGAAPAGPGGPEVSPEIQQALQALQALLESGQITEEEAMQVLTELGLVDGGQGGAPVDPAAGPAMDPASAGGAPAPAGPPAPPAEGGGESAPKKEEGGESKDKGDSEKKEDKKEESDDKEAAEVTDAQGPKEESVTLPKKIDSKDKDGDLAVTKK